MATHQDLAVLSDCVYGDGTVQGWTKLNVPLPPPSGTGFYAAAYRNDTTGDVVVAFRGTDDGRDLSVDGSILLGNTADQYPDALTFYGNVTTQYPGTPITLTGHSLGGALAQYVLAKDYEKNGAATQISNVVTYGAPGIRDYLEDKRLYTPALDAKVIGYIDKGDPVGQSGQALGVRVSVREVGLLEGFLQAIPFVHLPLMLSAHKMSNYLDASRGVPTLTDDQVRSVLATAAENGEMTGVTFGRIDNGYVLRWDSQGSSATFEVHDDGYWMQNDGRGTTTTHWSDGVMRTEQINGSNITYFPGTSGSTDTRSVGNNADGTSVVRYWDDSGIVVGQDGAEIGTVRFESSQVVYTLNDGGSHTEYGDGTIVDYRPTTGETVVRATDYTTAWTDGTAGWDGTLRYEFLNGDRVEADDIRRAA